MKQAELIDSIQNERSGTCVAQLLHLCSRAHWLGAKRVPPSVTATRIEYYAPSFWPVTKTSYF